jgi:Holliday junction resolvase RusA-like endonuclease
MKRDKDNVLSVCMKVIQDALQTCGVIDNDGWANIENFTHDFYLDAQNPRIEVYIEEKEN